MRTGRDCGREGSKDVGASELGGERAGPIELEVEASKEASEREVEASEELSERGAERARDRASEGPS